MLRRAVDISTSPVGLNNSSTEITINLRSETKCTVLNLKQPWASSP